MWTGSSAVRCRRSAVSNCHLQLDALGQCCVKTKRSCGNGALATTAPAERGAAPVTRYPCPLCKSPLTKERYEAVVKIQEARDRATEAQLARAHAEAHRQRSARQELARKLRESR